MGANSMRGRYIGVMDNVILDRDADIVGRHGGDVHLFDPGLLVCDGEHLTRATRFATIPSRSHRRGAAARLARGAIPETHTRRGGAPLAFPGEPPVWGMICAGGMADLCSHHGARFGGRPE